jgi:adenylate cyclase
MEAVKEFIQMLIATAPAEQEIDRITASLAVQISDAPTKVFDGASTSTFQKIKTSSQRVLPIKRLAVCLAAALLAIPISSLDVSKRMEYEQLDNLFRVRGARKPSQDVVIVSIDEPSYLNLGIPMGDTWPRRLHAKLLDKLQRYGAKKVIFDILFVSPSADPAADEEFAQALSKVPTVLGASIGLTQQATANGSFSLEQMIRPLPLFERNAESIGVVGFPQFHSRIRGFYAARSELFPDAGSLAEAASDSLQASKKPGERDLINYYGPAATVRRFSYHDVLSDESRLPAEAFKDKRVFVGLNLQSRTGPSQREAFTSPFDSGVFGTEIHATATSNLLNRDWIRRAGQVSEVSVCVLLAGALLVVVSMLSGRIAIVSATATVLVGLLAQCGLFHVGLFMPLVVPIAFGVLGGFVLRMWFHQNPSSRKGRWR